AHPSADARTMWVPLATSAVKVPSAVVVAVAATIAGSWLETIETAAPTRGSPSPVTVPVMVLGATEAWTSAGASADAVTGSASAQPPASAHHWSPSASRYRPAASLLSWNVN